MKNKNLLRSQLRELAELRPTSEATQRAMASVREALLTQPQGQQSLWSFVMQHRRPAAAAALAASLVAAILLLNGQAKPAFAQVVDRVERTKSVQYLETHILVPRAGEPRGPMTTTRVMILGRSLERKEMIAETAGEPLEAGHSWTRRSSGISINDYANGKLVFLDPKKKTFSEAKKILGLSGTDGKVTETKVAPAPEADFYARIRDVPTDKAKRLEDREIDGKTVHTFRTVEESKSEDGDSTWTRTYWVDANTNLPRQIETEFQSTNPRMGNSRWIQSDIVFDEPLDESLFSTSPPKDYTVVKD
jgi:outer membrane lipoprotein-sorting protein